MKRPLSIALSLLATVLLIWWLLRQVAIADIINALGRVPLATIGLSFIMYFLVQVLRSIRAWLLLRRQVPADRLLAITCIQNALINILPARLGELGYVFLVKKESNLGSAIGSLGVARVFDLSGIMILFIGAALISPLPATITPYAIPIFVTAGMIVTLTLLLLFGGEPVIRVLGRLSDSAGFKTFINKLEEILHSVHVLKSLNVVLLSLVLSTAIWVLQFIFNAMVFQAVGADVSYPHLFLAATVMAFLSAIPIQGVIGFGTTETFWLVSLASVGVTAEIAILGGFVQHILSIVFMLVLGIYGILSIRRSKAQAL